MVISIYTNLFGVCQCNHHTLIDCPNRMSLGSNLQTTIRTKLTLSLFRLQVLSTHAMVQFLWNMVISTVWILMLSAHLVCILPPWLTRRVVKYYWEFNTIVKTTLFLSPWLRKQKIIQRNMTMQLGLHYDTWNRSFKISSRSLIESHVTKLLSANSNCVSNHLPNFKYNNMYNW